jgi:formylglycine-generating enzyme required for sulfatase activity
MSWKVRCLSFVKKYGKAAKVVAGAVLNVVAPGSGALVNLVDLACDKASEVAQDHWEQALLEATQNNTAELQRLGQLFELLSGELATLCDRALKGADHPDELPDILRRAIAADPSLSRVLHQVDALKTQFTAFQDDLRRIAQHQQDALRVYERMHGVADYFDELRVAGVTPRDFAHLLQCRQEAVVLIAQGNTAAVDGLLLELRTAAPRAASVFVLEAAVATREHNYPAAQRALTSAVKLRPADAELVELKNRVTVLATRATPPPPIEKTPVWPRLQPGDTLDGWHLESRLGAGGWGNVFKATRQGQVRAIKVMHGEYAADDAFVERFKQEVGALLRLPRHPNLVGIEGRTAFGYCKERQTWYLAMEHIDGPTLESYLAAKGPLTEGQVRKIFPDAIAGLAKAHAAGIVHRDIKPGNLIIRKSDSRLVFVDFGLAVGVEELGQTKVGGISIVFASPEQHYGESATQASDVFSLCAVIHYALNYDKPDLRKPNRFSPALVPQSLRDALVQGMKPNVDERLSDAAQLLAVLQPQAKPPTESTGPTADPVTEYAQWKQQVEELKAQAARAADVFDYTRAVAILEKVPSKHRSDAPLADWKEKRDRLAILWPKVESGWREMSEDELADHLEEIIGLHPDHPRAKPWLEQCGTAAERKRRKLSRGKVGATITNSLGMQFAWVPPGDSWLGGGDGKPGTTKFTLKQGLWCGVFPVTQAEWQAVAGSNPSHFKDNPRYPVESVSWNDAQKFIEQLNQRTRADGLVYRLPTEQEWEYICRGGPLSQDQSKYHFYFARSKTDLTSAPTNNLASTQANFDGRTPAGSAANGPYLQRPSDVDLYLPNPLGIYDLHGNVWEWTSSQEGSARVIRGGSWYSRGADCAAAYRRRSEAGYASEYVGFRLLAVPSS